MRLDGNDLYQMVKTGSVLVKNNRAYLNDINFFPVPDGDTGNNLVYTMNLIAVEAIPNDSFHKTLDSISETAMLSARGNSGVIFAQFLNGMFKSSKDYETVGVNEFASLAYGSVDYVYKSISNPVEGTIITVLREWANFLNTNKEKYNNIKEFLVDSYHYAKECLEKTKTTLQILKKNKVVDSGAMGFVLFLEGFNKYLNNETVDEVQSPVDLIIDEHVYDENILYRYCTEGLFEQNANLDNLKTELETLGDSLIILEGKKYSRIHIHTNNPEIVFDKLDDYGNILTQKVDDMLLEVNSRNHKHEIAIVTDSIADIDKEFALENNIFVIPTNIIINSVSYIDKFTINNEILFEKIKNSKEYPTTSVPEIKYINNLFSKLLLQYKKIIVLTVASKLSSTYNVINDIASKLNDKGNDITVIDSLNNSASEGLLVYQLVKMRNRGLSKDAMIMTINEIKKKTKILVCLDTFKYATLSGRVPKIIGKIGMLLKIRPIMSLDATGAGTAFGFALSKKGITKKIMKLVKKDDISEWSLVHCENTELVNEYKTLFTSIIKKEPSFISELSSATAIHSGKKSVAIAYIKK
ncbi:hypothetical protein CI105_04915 [Candidatus Izimaplasma bacterium ZiA1]|uniref:DegV family protein n=1 Tax=Candidatus Izimoplasma sp. ZiA1 TaxID=2024899 RepID=UPI000BAA7EB8|nr:hypothetical protein CI105_04915 [Candidatus Izimaplasma bacterium ZiA1]